MAYEGTKIGADGKRYKADEVPEDDAARKSTDEKTQAMQEQREKAKLNAASIGNREWSNATQNMSNADGPVFEETPEEQPIEGTQITEDGTRQPVEGEAEDAAAGEAEATDETSEEDAEAAEKQANLDAVSDVEGDFPKHKGGGWFVLSDGTLVQGKEDAEKAESEL